MGGKRDILDGFKNFSAQVMKTKRPKNVVTVYSVKILMAVFPFDCKNRGNNFLVYEMFLFILLLCFFGLYYVCTL